MLSHLRQRFWMVGAGSAIKSVVSKCVVCRKYKGKCQVQKMADLPAARLTPSAPPFSQVGVDYFGPFMVKRGRSVVKRYGVIFTCMAIRAVHLEIAHSLDTDSCIGAIRRLIARRGPVKHVWSDNGTNLVGAERLLREEISKWNQLQIQHALLQKGIDWHFSPPYGSHHGGVWERMIRSVRKILFGLMNEQVYHLDDESLQTLFCEVEGILNSRPISEMSSDPKDLSALTPNHLLLLQSGEVLPPGTFTAEDNIPKRRWRIVQYLSDQFWKRWTREYLPLLQQRQKWTNVERNIKKGDIVLLMDKAPRNSWAMGRVVQANTDKQGLVRVAEVQTQSGLVVRPVSKLCLLLEQD